MPEEAEALGITTGTATATPGEKTSDGPVEEPFVSSDAPAPSADAPEGDDDTAEAFDWSSVDLRRTRAEDVPEAHRKTFEHLSRQAKAAQGEATRQIQDIQRREQQIAERERQILEHLQRIQQPQGPQTQQQAAAQAQQRVSDMLNDPNIDQDTRNGLMLVQRAFKEMFTEMVGDRFEQLDKLSKTLPQLQETIQTFSQERQTERFREISTQAQDAFSQYGDDVNAFSDGVRRLVGLDENNQPVHEPLVNRETGKPHTIKSAYELLAGITTQRAQEARNEDAAIKKKAKKSAVLAPSTPSPSNGNGEMTESEARAQVKDLLSRM